MSWFILIMISVFSLSITNLLQRVLMKDKKSDPVAYGLAFQWLSAFLIGIYAFWNGFVLPPVRELPFNFILSAVSFGFGTIILFKALKTTEVSEVTVLFSSRGLWVIAIAILFLGESFDIQKIIGTFLILAAILLVFFEREKIKFRKGGLYALLGAFFYGIGIPNDAFIISRSADVPSYLAFTLLLQGIVIFLSKPSVIKKMKLFLHKDTLTKMLLIGIFFSIFLISFYLAYQSGGNISQLSPISQSAVIVTVVLAAIFLKERKHLIRKIIAAFFVSIGVLLLR